MAESKNMSLEEQLVQLRECWNALWGCIRKGQSLIDSSQGRQVWVGGDGGSKPDVEVAQLWEAGGRSDEGLSNAQLVRLGDIIVRVQKAVAEAIEWNKEYARLWGDFTRIWRSLPQDLLPHHPRLTSEEERLRRFGPRQFELRAKRSRRPAYLEYSCFMGESALLDREIVCFQTLVAWSLYSATKQHESWSRHNREWIDDLIVQVKENALAKISEEGGNLSGNGEARKGNGSVLGDDELKKEEQEKVSQGEKEPFDPNGVWGIAPYMRPQFDWPGKDDKGKAAQTAWDLRLWLYSLPGPGDVANTIRLITQVGKSIGDMVLSLEASGREALASRLEREFEGLKSKGFDYDSSSEPKGRAERQRCRQAVLSMNGDVAQLVSILRVVDGALRDEGAAGNQKTASHHASSDIDRGRGIKKAAKPLKIAIDLDALENARYFDETTAWAGPDGVTCLPPPASPIIDLFFPLTGKAIAGWREQARKEIKTATAEMRGEAGDIRRAYWIAGKCLTAVRQLAQWSVSYTFYAGGRESVCGQLMLATLTEYLSALSKVSDGIRCAALGGSPLTFCGVCEGSAFKVVEYLAGTRYIQSMIALGINYKSLGDAKKSDLAQTVTEAMWKRLREGWPTNTEECHRLKVALEAEEARLVSRLEGDADDGRPKAPSGEDQRETHPEPAGDQKKIDGLRPCDRTAFVQYGRASESLGGCTDKEAYAWAKEHNDGAPLPTLESWVRYLRRARMVYGCQKNTPRAGRGAGRSIVQSKDVEYQGRDEDD